VARSFHHDFRAARGTRRIAWFLFITHTNLSVPALMGAIMCMGVATSNSILVVALPRKK